MALLNAATRVLHVNIAYYGPALSGKLTNLRAIHAAARPETRSEWAVAIEPSPVVAFYFAPLVLGGIDGRELCFHLSALPGFVFEDASRKHLLRNVDGIVFGADSQVARLLAVAVDEVVLLSLAARGPLLVLALWLSPLAWPAAWVAGDATGLASPQTPHSPVRPCSRRTDQIRLRLSRTVR